MRVTVTKHETPQGRVLVKHEKGLEWYSEQSLLGPTVFVTFLNQKYDEYHFGIWTEWDRKTSLLGFLYGFYIGETHDMNELGDFYRETRTVQEEIIRIIEPVLSGSSEAEASLHKAINDNLDVYLRPLPFGKEDEIKGSFKRRPESGFGLWRAAYGSFAVEHPTFRAYVYGLLSNICEDGHLPKIAKCLWCGKFFVRPDTRNTHCSRLCQKLKDRLDSGDRHLKRPKIKEPSCMIVKRHDPEKYLSKLVSAEKADRTGKLLPIYKRLGGAQEGRKLIRTLEGKSWKDLPQNLRNKVSDMLKEYPDLEQKPTIPPRARPLLMKTTFDKG
jgi:hypothetical protein